MIFIFIIIIVILLGIIGCYSEFVFVDLYYHYCYFISSFIVIAFITVVLRRNIKSGRGDE